MQEVLLNLQIIIWPFLEYSNTEAYRCKHQKDDWRMEVTEVTLSFSSNERWETHKVKNLNIENNHTIAYIEVKV